MGRPYYPAQLTQMTYADFLAAAGAAWAKQRSDKPSDSSLRILLAHWCLETGHGKQMYCYNVGNAKATDAWQGGVTYYQGNEILGGKVVWFDFNPTLHGGQLLNRFRAYPGFQPAVEDYLRLKQTRYKAAWERVVAGDIDGYADELEKSHYYTAGSSYKTTLKKVYHEKETIPVPAPREVMGPKLAPAGCDPMDANNPNSPVREPGFRPVPPIGPPPPELYAKHLGYQPGVSRELPLLLEGYDCAEAPLKPKPDPPKPDPPEPDPPKPDPPKPDPPKPDPPEPDPPKPDPPKPDPSGRRILKEALVPAVLVSSPAAPTDILLPRAKTESLEFVAISSEGKPLAGWHFLVLAADGSRHEGLLPADARARFDLVPGNCTVQIRPEAPPPVPPAPSGDWKAEVGDGETSHRRACPIEDILDKLKNYRRDAEKPSR